MNVDDIAARVRSEFEEMPGLRLTMGQASKLFGLRQEECRTIVDRLVKISYLRWTNSGAVTRAA